MTLGGPVSKYIGNDMTGGPSGGPWWLNVGHHTLEYADTDGLCDTDPFQAAANVFPLINGVNSNKRCNVGGCPAGYLFTQEMGSPQFHVTMCGIWLEWIASLKSLSTHPWKYPRGEIPKGFTHRRAGGRLSTSPELTTLMKRRSIPKLFLIRCRRAQKTMPAGY